tara:strand:+ start:453 stop:1373 length:921 start_codon:yes stop_codon:yes gene_type:complete
MRVLIPFTVEDSNLISSTIPENDYPVWSSGTSYVSGDLVISTVTHRIYEALQSSTNVNPTTDTSDPPFWLNIGATNRWRAFDQKIGNPVTVADGVNIINYELGNFGIPSNSVTLFGLKGRVATLIVSDATDGEVYNKDISLIDNALVNDWFTYFFEPARVKSEAIFESIPPYANATYDVTIEDITANKPELGQLVLGQEYTLGVTNYGTSVSIEDFSRKERDAFGNAILVERPFAKLIDFDFTVNTNEVRRTAILLETVRALPAVYYAGPETERYGTTVYGFFRSFSINLNGPAISNVTLEVEGLT